MKIVLRYFSGKFGNALLDELFEDAKSARRLAAIACRNKS